MGGATDFCCCVLLFVLISHASSSLAGGDRGVRGRYLKHNINSPGKIIKTKYGDVVECVDSHKQPAFDHPLLENHTLQMHPGSYPYNINEGPPNNFLPFLNYVGCPEGTVPIRKTHAKGQSIRSSRSGYRRKISVPGGSSPNVMNGCILERGNKYYGAKANLNTWHPIVQGSHSFSTAQIWMVSQDGQSTMEAGWMIDTSEYIDSYTRLFTYWTTDGSKNTGCFNVDCPGFILTNKDYYLNSIFDPTSTYGGYQLLISVEITKDLSTGHWWFVVSNITMGYWPSEVLPVFKDSVAMVQLGGEVNIDRIPGQHTVVEMGSGHFSEEGYSKAAYINNIQVMDKTGTYRDAPNIVVAETNHSCYNVQIDENKSSDWGTAFYYGGPGCPA